MKKTHVREKINPYLSDQSEISMYLEDSSLIG